MESQFRDSERIDQRLLVGDHVGARLQGAPGEPADPHQGLLLHGLPGGESLPALARPPLVIPEKAADGPFLVILFIGIQPVPGLLPGQRPVRLGNRFLVLEIEVAEVFGFQAGLRPGRRGVPQDPPVLLISTQSVLYYPTFETD